MKQRNSPVPTRGIFKMLARKLVRGEHNSPAVVCLERDLTPLKAFTPESRPLAVCREPVFFGESFPKLGKKGPPVPGVAQK